MDSAERELLALRKDLLVARAMQQRLRAVRDAGILVDAVRAPRSLLFGLVMLVAGSGRLGRWIAVAGAALALAKASRRFGAPRVDPHQSGGAG